MAATCRVRVEQLFSVLTSDLVIGGGGGIHCVQQMEWTLVNVLLGKSNLVKP